ncbi:hypothetical protein MMC30_007684 [Trapelia coarctata]|nr:hypothetical protein [Trapelia coarctata]
MATPASQEPFTEINAACHCGQLAVSIEVPTASLPLELYLCACDTCRHNSGHLAITAVLLPSNKRNLKVKGKAEKYATSDGPDGLFRCFCGVCGANVYEDSPNEKKIGLCGGALTKAEGIVAPKCHIFVGDTKDGGMRDWIPQIPAWEAWDSPQVGQDEVAHAGDFIPRAKVPESSLAEKLHCSCHCGGVQFDITRPNKESRKVEALYHPKKRLCPDGKRYIAIVCTCNACRQCSGYDLQPWAFVPMVNMEKPDGNKMDFNLGTLKAYESSEGKTRYFCSNCGAKVFWKGSTRPLIIDVSVGLTEAPSGARGEEWLDWHTDRVIYSGFAQNKSLVEMLEAGLKSRGERTKLEE